MVLTVGDLFCGCGGFLDGFRQAGYEVKFGIDIYDKAIETFRHNFNGALAINDDIKNVDIGHVPHVDVLLFGFPCKGFSIAGLRDPNDPRSNLYREGLRFLIVMRPAAFVCENVEGLLSMEDGNVFKRIIDDLSSVGYKVVHKLMLASDYGVPQSRKRVFIVGIRDDIDEKFEFPKKSDDVYTVRDAIQFLPEPKGKFKRFKRGSEEYETFKKHALKKYCVMSRDDIPNLNEYTRSKHDTMIRAINSRFRQGQKLLVIDRPFLTVTENHGNTPIIVIMDDEGLYLRRTTVREMARAQSFSDDFEFKGGKTAALIQLGNAVPPLLAKKIAEQLLITILGHV
ncbi:MAG: DNA cytosine methyltransferase [Promethearchaeota archaeon]|nr:MAG: C5 DNA methyltransferase [Helarchaeota virus Nidhogg Meg22_1012]URC17349.1 MAG: C5 DNA methyltransferase [Helarchaeota virus Nidhogg Meg22_1214]